MMILSAELFITQHIFVMWALIENCMICGHGSIRHNVPETNGSIPRRGAKPNIWKFALSARVCAADVMTKCSQLQISCAVSSVELCKRLIGEVVQSWRGPLLGPSPG